MNAMSGLVSPKTLSDLSGLPIHQIRSAAARKQIPHTRTLAGWIRFEPVSALAAISRLTAEAASEEVPWGPIPLPDVIERVYVAGASSEIIRCERFIARVRAVGIDISYDWTVGARNAPVGPEDLDDFLAPLCLSGVAASDAVVLLAPLPGHSTVGAWAEMGAGFGLRKPVVLVSPESIHFGCMAHRVDTKRAALDLLRERAPKGGLK